ncbi:hypothetical protein MPSEU_000499500 [Mayamaea pseudoterrestris]|nr:hypothetical protein MPSEU_000499500 [Mayamaea pseudoterrestris]
MNRAFSILLCVSAYTHSFGFAPGGIRTSPWGLSILRLQASSTDVDAFVNPSGSSEESLAIRAPLKFIGPYPTLALRFPKLATDAQRARNVTGVSLDFVLDTAANTNTIQQQVARELGLKVVGKALPGVTTAGAMLGGETYMLGDAQLDGLPADAGNFTFMTQLTASALPVASPAAAGLLSLAFLYTFDGVCFDWTASEDKPPSVTFYERVPESALAGMTRVAIQPVPMTQLPSIMLRVNGCDMPALLDTGSPITVFNAEAAKQAGIETIATGTDGSSKNPFTSMANRFQVAQAMSRGDVLQVLGEKGPVNLLKSSSPITVSLPGTKVNSMVDFALCSVYVGDLPGLAALQGLVGADASSPAIVLGMDVLRQRPKMLLRPRRSEVWF